MSATERLAAAADRLTGLEVPVPTLGASCGGVDGDADLSGALRSVRSFSAESALVARSDADHATVATGITQTALPDGPIGLTRGDAFWPDAQHRPSSAVALGQELAALLGWGDSAKVEIVCAVLTPDTCQPVDAAPDDKPTQLRISSPATGAEVTAMASGDDSGWAFFGIGQSLFPPVHVDGPQSATLYYPRSSPPVPPGTQDVRWWAATHDGELFGAVPYGSPIRIQAPAQSIVSALVVFVDEHGNALGAQGSSVSSAAGVTCCNLDLPTQFVYHRVVLASPRDDDRPTLGPTDVLATVDRFFASAPVELSWGRYTDLDYVALQPGGSTPLLTDRLVWVLIEAGGEPAGPVGEVVHIVDAYTGEELLYFGGPPGATCPIEPGAEPDRCGNP